MMSAGATRLDGGWGLSPGEDRDQRPVEENCFDAGECERGRYASIKPSEID